MITPGIVRQALRITVDASASDVELLDELESKAGFGSKREIMLSGLRLLAGLRKARLRGLQPQLFNPESNECVDFDWQHLPEVPPVTPRRLVSLVKVRDETMRALVATAADMNDFQIEGLVSRIAAAKWNLSSGQIEAETLTDLLLCAIGSPNAQLLRLARDLVTQIYTEYVTFSRCVEDAIHLRRLDLDSRLVEQRFLSDQYRIAVIAAFGRNLAAPNKGALPKDTMDAKAPSDEN